MHLPSPDEIAAYVRAGNETLGMLRTLVGMLPKNEKRDEIERRILEAEKALRVSEVNLAKALGYKLCQCEFPPNIMLSQGKHNVHWRVEVFACKACGRQDPPNEYFDELDRIKAENESLKGPLSWMAR